MSANNWPKAALDHVDGCDGDDCCGDSIVGCDVVLFIIRFLQIIVVYIQFLKISTCGRKAMNELRLEAQKCAIFIEPI